MGGFLSFLFLLLVIWLLLHCVHGVVRLIGESLGESGEVLARGRRLRGRAPRPCPNPHCRRDNRGEARFCAQCGQPLAPRSSLAVDHAW